MNKSTLVNKIKLILQTVLLTELLRYNEKGTI